MILRILIILNCDQSPISSDESTKKRAQTNARKALRREHEKKELRRKTKSAQTNARKKRAQTNARKVLCLKHSPVTLPLLHYYFYVSSYYFYTDYKRLAVQTMVAHQNHDSPAEQSRTQKAYHTQTLLAYIPEGSWYIK